MTVGQIGHRSTGCSVPFCSVLWPSSIWVLAATPWTYFLRLSLSSVILTDSSTGSPVYVLMLSIQAVRGLPRLRAPGIVPCIISLSPGNSLVFSWCDHSMLASLLWRCLTVPSLLHNLPDGAQKSGACGLPSLSRKGAAYFTKYRYVQGLGIRRDFRFQNALFWRFFNLYVKNSLAKV